MNSVKVSGVGLKTARPEQIERGLLGFVAFVLNGSFLLDGLALRRTREGRLTLSWPARRDQAGRDHYVVRPLDDDARVAVEHAVLKALHLEDAEA